MINKIKKHIADLKGYVISLFGCAAVLGIAYFAGLNTLIADATTLVFKTDCVTSSATTTLKYLELGTGTTTLTCAMGNDGATSATLAIQVNASSTNTTYSVYTEESMDGIDWYPIGQEQIASTTNPFGLGVRAFSTFAFASSTIGGSRTPLLGASTTYNGWKEVDNRNHYVLDIPVRMKWVRAYIVLPIPATWGTGLLATSTYNGAVWAQIIPKIGI